jgi:hypothetical protein
MELGFFSCMHTFLWDVPLNSHAIICITIINTLVHDWTKILLPNLALIRGLFPMPSAKHKNTWNKKDIHKSPNLNHPIPGWPTSVR